MFSIYMHLMKVFLMLVRLGMWFKLRYLVVINICMLLHLFRMIEYEGKPSARSYEKGVITNLNHRRVHDKFPKKNTD